MNIDINLDKIKQSKDGRTVIKNFGYLSLLQIAGYVFPLLTMPYLARVIGADGFGKIAFAAAIMSWIQTIADWGFNLTATRDVAQHREDINAVSHIFSNVLWSRIFLSAVSAVILLLATMFIPICRDNALIIWVSYLMIPGHIFFPDWFFQAVEKMKFTTIFNILLKLVFTLAVFIFIKDKEDYILQPLFTSLGYVVCGIGALYLIIYKWHYKLYRPHVTDIINTIKNSTDVFLNNMMPNLYNSFSVMLLGRFGGPSATGFFDGGNKFISIFFQLQTVLSRAFFPFLSRRSDKISLFAKINLFSGCLISVVLLLFAPLIVKIMLGPEFQGSIIVLRILSISFIFMALNNTYGQNYLIITHHERDLRNITMLSSILGMVLATPLVIYSSYIGAAVTILVSRIMIGSLAYYRAKKYMTNN